MFSFYFLPFSFLVSSFIISLIIIRLIINKSSHPGYTGPQPIREQHSAHVTALDQSESRILFWRQKVGWREKSGGKGGRMRSSHREPGGMRTEWETSQGDVQRGWTKVGPGRTQRSASTGRRMRSNHREPGGMRTEWETSQGDVQRGGQSVDPEGLKEAPQQADACAVAHANPEGCALSGNRVVGCHKGFVQSVDRGHCPKVSQPYSRRAAILDGRMGLVGREVRMVRKNKVAKNTSRTSDNKKG